MHFPVWYKDLVKDTSKEWYYDIITLHRKKQYKSDTEKNESHRNTLKSHKYFRFFFHFGLNPSNSNWNKHSLRVEIARFELANLKTYDLMLIVALVPSLFKFAVKYHGLIGWCALTVMISNHFSRKSPAANVFSVSV